MDRGAQGPQGKRWLLAGFLRPGGGRLSAYGTPRTVQLHDLRADVQGDGDEGGHQDHERPDVGARNEARGPLRVLDRLVRSEHCPEVTTARKTRFHALF